MIIDALGNYVQYNRHCRDTYSDFVLYLVHTELTTLLQIPVKSATFQDYQAMARIMDIVNRKVCPHVLRSPYLKQL
jgi:hypothetical protein